LYFEIFVAGSGVHFGKMNLHH